MNLELKKKNNSYNYTTLEVAGFKFFSFSLSFAGIFFPSILYREQELF